jgi:hypothetical protein
MTDIPITHPEFESWFERNKADWPAELQRLGEHAKLTLWQIDNNPPSQIQAMQELAPGAWRALVKSMMDFAAAYGAWRAGR